MVDAGTELARDQISTGVDCCRKSLSPIILTYRFLPCPIASYPVSTVTCGLGRVWKDDR